MTEQELMAEDPRRYTAPRSTSDIAPTSGRPARPRMFRLPGVYHPQEDSQLLVDALRDLRRPAGFSALDACTGSGLAAVAAAQAGAGEVTAIDISRRAVFSAKVNALFRGIAVTTLRENLLVAELDGRYDVILCNPPYVPTPDSGVVRPGVPWDAGPKGRALLDPLCDMLPRLLQPGGDLLLVHSEFSDVERTLAQLGACGLTAEVVARQQIPFGPVVRSRVAYLRAANLLDPEARQEEIVVIRGHRRLGAAPGMDDHARSL